MAHSAACWLGVQGTNDRLVGGTSPPLMLFTLGGVQVSDMAMSPNGSYVAVAAKDGVLRIYSFPGANLVGGFKVRSHAYGSLAWFLSCR